MKFTRRFTKIRKIQAFIRGYLVRRKLMTLSDSMTPNILIQSINAYINTIRCEKKINKSLRHKKIRLSNFPSHISENIVKFAIYKKYNIMPSWDTGRGDLILKLTSQIMQIEVKGFISNGPSSFGPSEQWDKIYFVDGTNFMNKRFKVYEINLSNTNPIFRSIKLTKQETYGQIADKNQRGKLRGTFYKTFKPQLSKYCKLIFNNNIYNLFTKY